MADGSWTCENGHRNPSREVTRCLDCDAPSCAASGPLYPHRPADADARDARSVITTCGWIGGGLVLVCSLLVAVSFSGQGAESAFLLLIAALGLLLGSGLLLVALVAEGVRLGLRSLGLPRTDQA